MKTHFKHTSQVGRNHQEQKSTSAYTAPVRNATPTILQQAQSTATITPDAVMQLQQTVGNRSTTQFLSSLVQNEANTLSNEQPIQRMKTRKSTRDQTKKSKKRALEQEEDSDDERDDSDTEDSDTESDDHRRRKIKKQKTSLTKDVKKSLKTPKKMDWKRRLQRAHERAARRHPKGTALGTRVDAPTPFGMTGLSRQRFNQYEPQQTTRTSDFKKTTHPGDNYAGWIGSEIGTQGDFKKMVEEIDRQKEDRQQGKVKISPPKNFSAQKNRNASILFGTTHYSEELRFNGASKVSRSAMRQIANGKEKPSAFPQLFPMAGVNGAHSLEDFLKEKNPTKPSQKVIDTIENMSDSSDDEDQDLLTSVLKTMDEESE